MSDAAAMPSVTTAATPVSGGIRDLDANPFVLPPEGMSYINAKPGDTVDTSKRWIGTYAPAQHYDPTK